MGIGPLRLRRDREENQRAFIPDSAEPFLNTQNRRLAAGDGVALGGRSLITAPPAHGDPIQQIWQVPYYGSSGPASVTPLFTNRMRPLASGVLPQFSISDGGKIVIEAEGTYRVGSMAPAISFLPVLEDMAGTRYELRPTNVTYNADGFTMSRKTAGVNALGGYDGWFNWRLKIVITGSDYAALDGAGGSTNDNLSITGHIETDEWWDGNNGGGAMPTIARGAQWSMFNGFLFDRGNIRVAGTTPYKALVKHGNTLLTAANATEVMDSVNHFGRTAPGYGIEYQTYWHRMRQRTMINTSAEVPIQDLNALHLLVGGPHRTDAERTFNTWLATPAAVSFYAADHLDGLVVQGGRYFVSRRDHPVGGEVSLEPGVDPGGGEADGLWNRDWRELRDPMVDDMRVLSTSAILYGSRAGVSTKIYL